MRLNLKLLYLQKLGGLYGTDDEDFPPYYLQNEVVDDERSETSTHEVIF